MKLRTMPIFLLLLGPGSAIAAAQSVVPPAGSPGRPLGWGECSRLWDSTGAREELNADQAALYITNFEQADTDKDNRISKAEFITACTSGWVQAQAGR